MITIAWWLLVIIIIVSAFAGLILSCLVLVKMRNTDHRRAYLAGFRDGYKSASRRLRVLHAQGNRVDQAPGFDCIRKGCEGNGNERSI